MKLMRITLLSLALLPLFATIEVKGQADLCQDCPCLLRQAQKMQQAKLYREAISLYNAYSACNPNGQLAVADSISEIYNILNRQTIISEQNRIEAEKAKQNADRQKKRADEAAAKSRKQARANHNLAVTRRTLEQDPTMALRMAERSAQDHPDNVGILQAYADIFSDKNKFFYQRQLFKGHQDAVLELAISPDGQTLLSGSNDKTARLWDKNGNLLHTFASLPSEVVFVEFSPKGDKFLFGNKSWIAIGNTKGQTLSAVTLPSSRESEAFAFSPDGNSWAYGDNKGQLQRWDCNGEWLDSIGTNIGKINKIYFSPDGKHLLACGTDSSAVIWNLKKGRYALLGGHIASVIKGAFSPDGEQVITLSDTTARLWNLKGDSLNTFSYRAPTAKRASEFDKITFLTNDSLLFEFQGIPPLLASKDKSLYDVQPFTTMLEETHLDFETKLRDNWMLIFSKPLSGENQYQSLGVRVMTKKGEWRGRFIMPSKNNWPAVTHVTPDQEVVLYFGNGDAFESYTFSKLRPVKFVSSEEISEPTDSPSNTGAYSAFSADSKSFAYHLPGSATTTIRKITDHPKKSSPLHPQRKQCTTTAVTLNPAENANQKFFLLTLNSDGTASLWDTTAREQWSTTNTGSPIFRAQFTANGREIFALHTDSGIWRWRFETNERLQIGKYPGQPKHLAVSPDGANVAVSGSDSLLHFWHLKNEESWEKISFPAFNDPIEEVSFLPNNQFFLVRTSRGEISLWDKKETEKPFNIWRGYPKNRTTRGWSKAVLSPTGDRLVLMGDENTVTLSDLHGGWMTELQGHDRVVGFATFSADGNQILTASDDNTLRLWNKEGRMTAIFAAEGEHQAPIATAAISPDGLWVLSVDVKGTAYLWKTPKAILQSGIEHFSLNELAGRDLLPDPSNFNDIDPTMETEVLLRTANNFLEQQDTLTAHKLFDYLLKKFPEQTVDVWYKWYITCEPQQCDLNTLITTLAAKNQDFYPIAWRFKKDGYYKEAKALYEYVIEKKGATKYLWDYLEICRLGNLPENKKLFVNETDPGRLASYAQFFVNKRDKTTARTLFAKSLQIEPNAQSIIGLMKIKNPNDRQLVREKTDSLSDPQELLRLADYFRESNQEPNAAALYRRVLAKEELPEASIGLFEVSMGNAAEPYSSAEMLRTNSTEALRRYADYFGGKNYFDLKIKTLERLIAIGTADAYDYFEHHRLLKSEKGEDNFSTLLELKSPSLLKGLTGYFAAQGTNEAPDSAVVSYERAAQLGERLLDFEDTRPNREALSAYYNSLGWRSMFAGDFAKSEKAIRRGIKVYKDNLFLYSNLPHTLLFQGQIEGAREIYLKYESKDYQPERKRPYYRDVYLADFASFRKHFLQNPNKPFTQKMMDDMAEIEKLLKKDATTRPENK